MFQMDAFFEQLNKIDEEPQASMIHMNELPIGKKFEVTLVNVTNNELCGRGVRFFFNYKEEAKFVYLPKRYTTIYTNEMVEATNAAIGSGHPPGFAFMGVNGPCYKVKFFTFFHGMYGTWWVFIDKERAYYIF